MRIRALTACTLAVGALAMPSAVADPIGTLPPMTPTNGGPIIGGGGAHRRCHNNSRASTIPTSRKSTARTRLNSSLRQPVSVIATSPCPSGATARAWYARRTMPDSGRAATDAMTGNGEAPCSSSPRAPTRTSRG